MILIYLLCKWKYLSLCSGVAIWWRKYQNVFYQISAFWNPQSWERGRNYCTAGWKIVDVINVFLSSQYPASESSKFDKWYIVYLPLTMEASQLQCNFDPIIYVKFLLIRKINVILEEIKGIWFCSVLDCRPLLFPLYGKLQSLTIHHHAKLSDMESFQFYCLVKSKTKQPTTIMFYTWWQTTSSGNSSHIFLELWSDSSGLYIKCQTKKQ